MLCKMSGKIFEAAVEEDASILKLRFSPPVYVQRYQLVLDYIKELKPKKIADFGCAECKLIRQMKSENVNEIIGVDIDQRLLQNNINYLEPLLSDYVVARNSPLTIKLYKGSVSEFDSRFENLDLVTCIELIEHLYSDELNKLPANLFGRYRPNCVIISTPNSDFNVLFDTMPHGKFRHPDHKFEWTRKEFQDWCNDIANRYKYKVTFTGVGDPPYNHQDVGFCSQVAIFENNQKMDSLNECNEQSKSYFYELVKEIVYPYKTYEQQRKDDAVFLINETIASIVRAQQSRKLNDHLVSTRKLPTRSTYSISPPQRALPRHFHLTNRKKRMSPSKFLVQYHDVVIDQFQDAPLDSNKDILNLSEDEDFLKNFTETRILPLSMNKVFIKYLQEKYFNSPPSEGNFGQFEDAYQSNPTKNIIQDYSANIPSKNGTSDSHLPFTFCDVTNQLKITKDFILNRKDFKKHNFTKEELRNAVNAVGYRHYDDKEDLIIVQLDLYYTAQLPLNPRCRMSSPPYLTDSDDEYYNEISEDSGMSNNNTALSEENFIEENWDD